MKTQNCVLLDFLLENIKTTELFLDEEIAAYEALIKLEQRRTKERYQDQCYQDNRMRVQYNAIKAIQALETVPQEIKDILDNIEKELRGR